MIDRRWARFGGASALIMALIGAAAAQQSPAQQTPDDIAQLKAQVQQLQQQLQSLSKKLDEVTAKKTDAAPTAATAESGAANATEPEATQPTRPLIASSTPMIAPPPVTRPSSRAPFSAPIASPAPFQNPPESPLQLKIGDAYITPIGFMDMTGVWHNHAAGGSIGTSFGSIPYGNTYQTNLSEIRGSMQNSRVGFRVDALVHDAHVIGYMEADFLGNAPTNLVVSSNANTMRSRVYWVDVRKHNWELLGGQTWGLETPGRVGISPLPGNLFYTQDMDTNYEAGLVWTRAPELRIVYHTAEDKAAFAFAVQNPEQYMGGSSGGGSITLPALLTGFANTQLNNGGSTTSVPNFAPDFIAKIALDPSKHAHIEFGGLERNFKVANTVNLAKFTSHGAGGFVNMNFEILPGFRVLTNNYWSDGGGRYIFGQAPDLIVRSDGSLSPIHTGSTVSGFEYTHKNTIVFAYYGGIYIGRNDALDANGKTLIGYGFTGSSNSNNRTIQEATFGLNQTFWKDPKYGALNLIFQYDYLTRNPWYVAVGQPSNADLHEIWLDLRYTLPGSAPAMK
jgi:hypothetical protein